MGDPKTQEIDDIEEFLGDLQDDEQARMFGNLLDAQIVKCESLGWNRDAITAAVLGKDGGPCRFLVVQGVGKYDFVPFDAPS